MPLTLRSLACPRFKREQDWREVTTPYTNWFKQMVGYGFSEGQDYSLIEEETAGHPVSPNLARPRHNHIITLDMAKEISMIQRTERGKQARQYFIECERRMKQLQPEVTPEPILAKVFTLLKALFDHTAKTDYYGLVGSRN